jgi:hypothetical protein
MWGWLIFLFWLVLTIITSFETSRPLATGAAWLMGLAAILLWLGVLPEPSLRARAWGILVALGALALAAVELARDGRPGEIAIWLPALAAVLLGWVFFLRAVYDERVRVARGTLAAILLGVPFALWATVGNFTGSGF